MSSILGQVFILGGLAFATFGAIIGIGGGLAKGGPAHAWTHRMVWGFFGCMLLANLTMIYALVSHDFSVSYVAQVGSRATPLAFTIVSLWSALEGSILFWGVILASYILAFALSHRGEDGRFMSLALGTMLGVGVFFAFLIAGPAHPFTAVPPPIPTDGPGPNPLLQNHILMVIHPPMLYLGYVGMTVPFGVAAAGLLGGQVSVSWMAPLRRWTMLAWMFLTVGIILGAWWAYAVLGWGGYWAWDPVENASFLPWLTATAFMHSTMVQERRQMLKLWTLSLALASFLLTLLGTFMTRSGIFNSVHSFTQSDIGPTFLVFIAIVLVFSVVLLAVRGPLLVAEGRIQSLFSRETAILVNNLVFVAITFTVLLGTLYPLVSEAVRGVRVSVGEPYFNQMAVPGGVLVLFLMGLGPSLPWGSADPKAFGRQIAIPAILGILVAAACRGLGLKGFYPVLTFGLATTVTLLTLRELTLPARVRMREKNEGFLTAFVQSTLRARRRVGGYIVHLGVIGIIVAIAASSSYVAHATGTLTAGKALTISGYTVTFTGLATGEEPHRSWIGGKTQVTTASGKSFSLTPKMNFYPRNTDPIGTPAVYTSPKEDLYLSLLSFDNKTNTASFNAWTFPLVGWIWWNIPVLVLGTLIAIWPSRRRRVAASESAPEPAGSQATEGAA